MLLALDPAAAGAGSWVRGLWPDLAAAVDVPAATALRPAVDAVLRFAAAHGVVRRGFLATSRTSTACVVGDNSCCSYSPRIDTDGSLVPGSEEVNRMHVDAGIIGDSKAESKSGRRIVRTRQLMRSVSAGAARSPQQRAADNFLQFALAPVAQRPQSAPVQRQHLRSVASSAFATADPSTSCVIGAAIQPRVPARPAGPAHYGDPRRRSSVTTAAGAGGSLAIGLNSSVLSATTTSAPASLPCERAAGSQCNCGLSDSGGEISGEAEVQVGSMRPTSCSRDAQKPVGYGSSHRRSPSTFSIPPKPVGRAGRVTAEMRTKHLCQVKGDAATASLGAALRRLGSYVTKEMFGLVTFPQKIGKDSNKSVFHQERYSKDFACNDQPRYIYNSLTVN